MAAVEAEETVGEGGRRAQAACGGTEQRGGQAPAWTPVPPLPAGPRAGSARKANSAASSLVRSHSGPPARLYILPPDTTVPSTYSSYGPRLPMGTTGFSRVLRRNFSLKLSVLAQTLGVKPSMTGGCEGSKGVPAVAGPGAAIFPTTAEKAASRDSASG